VVGPLALRSSDEPPAHGPDGHHFLADAIRHAQEVPVPISPDGRSHRARVAALRRHHPDRPDLAAADQRALKTDALEQHIRAVLTGDNPPARAQRDQLARLLFDPDATLRGGDGDGAAA
jgi:hypothetical protein